MQTEQFMAVQNGMCFRVDFNLHQIIEWLEAYCHSIGEFGVFSERIILIENSIEDLVRKHHVLEKRATDVVTGEKNTYSKANLNMYHKIDKELPSVNNSTIYS